MSDEDATLPTGMGGLRYPITQISLVIEDIDALLARYHRFFGWAPWQVFDHVPPMHHNTELRGQPVDYSLRGAEVYVGSLNFELLQPISGDRTCVRVHSPARRGDRLDRDDVPRARGRRPGEEGFKDASTST